MGTAVAFGGGYDRATATMPSTVSGKASVVPSELKVVVMWIMATRHVLK